MTSNIQQEIKSINSFNDLLPIAQKAEARITFFGTRHIFVDGYNGTLNTDDLVRRVDKIMVQKPQWETVRHIGKLVANEINRIYSEDDQNIKNCGRITRFFIILRNLPEFILGGEISHSGKRAYWENSMEHIFDHPDLDYRGSFSPGKKYGYLNFKDSFRGSATLEFSDNSSSWYRDQSVCLT